MSWLGKDRKTNFRYSRQTIKNKPPCERGFVFYELATGIATIVTAAAATIVVATPTAAAEEDED